VLHSSYFLTFRINFWNYGQRDPVIVRIRVFCQVQIRCFIHCSEVWDGRTWQSLSSISHKTLTLRRDEHHCRQKQQDNGSHGAGHCDHWGKARCLLLYGQHHTNVTVTNIAWTRHYQISDSQMKLRQLHKYTVWGNFTGILDISHSHRPPRLLAGMALRFCVVFIVWFETGLFFIVRGC
jgi:hypothetical protein